MAKECHCPPLFALAMAGKSAKLTSISMAYLNQATGKLPLPGNFPQHPASFACLSVKKARGGTPACQDGGCFCLLHLCNHNSSATPSLAHHGGQLPAKTKLGVNHRLSVEGRNAPAHPSSPQSASAPQACSSPARLALLLLFTLVLPSITVFLKSQTCLLLQILQHLLQLHVLLHQFGDSPVLLLQLLDVCPDQPSPPLFSVLLHLSDHGLELLDVLGGLVLQLALQLHPRFL